MAFAHSQLSKTASDMFYDMLEEMRNQEFEAVNFPLLLWGVLNSSTENSIYCALENYLYSSEEVLPSEVEDNISLLVTNYEKKAEENASKKKKPFSKKEKDSQDSKSSAKDQKGKKKFGKKNKKDELPKMTTEYTFKDHEGKEIRFNADEEVAKVFDRLIVILEKYELKVIEPLHITSAMFMTDNKDFKQFFRDIDVNYDNAKKHFHPDRIMVCGIIPFQLASFLSTLNDKIDGKVPCEILGRDEEVERIWDICSKKNKRNTIIVGPPGVGKSALIEKLTHDINCGKCPEYFRKHIVVVLDVN